MDWMQRAVAAQDFLHPCLGWHPGSIGTRDHVGGRQRVKQGWRRDVELQKVVKESALLRLHRCTGVVCDERYDDARPTFIAEVTGSVQWVQAGDGQFFRVPDV